MVTASCANVCASNAAMGSWKGETSDQTVLFDTKFWEHQPFSKQKNKEGRAVAMQLHGLNELLPVSWGVCARPRNETHFCAVPRKI
jgi:hypothetical protein